MFGKLVPKLIFAGALLACGAAWAADPTVDQVYQAAKAGNYSQAQSMMDQVLRDHPNSAKAHFIEAELLAKQNKLNAARGELDKAQQLDPGMSFAKPEAIQELKSQLASSGSVGSVRSSGGVHVPWGPLLGILAVIVVILMMVRARSQRVIVEPGPAGWRPAPGGPMPNGPMPGGGYYGPGGGGMMPPAAGGGIGSGIMGGLATGAAVGAGMVAGEALMHKVMGDGSSHQQAMPVDTSTYEPGNPAGNYDMGGNDFGVNDAGSWDDGGGSSGSDWGDGGGSSNDDWS